MIDPVEQRIIDRLFEALEKRGFKPHYIDFLDGIGERVTAEEAKPAIFSVDESAMHFVNQNGEHEVFWFVLGNGEDVISNYTSSDVADDCFDYAVYAVSGE